MLRRACDTGGRKRPDPKLRAFTLAFALAFGIVGMVAGFYLGFSFVSHDRAIASPLFEKIFLNTFIAISCGTAGVITGAFVGSTIYRFKEHSGKKG